jgi:eukaryotic-like serine/threonine-protein kinase
MISRRPVAAKQAREPRRRKRRLGVLWPIAAVLAVLAVAALAALGAIALRNDDGDPQAAPTQPIPLTGIGAYDPPPGDNTEHDDEAVLATDGDLSTFWRTESYSSGLNKPGVGLVLDAGDTVEPKTMTVTTDTPGFTAEVRAGDSPDGPWETVSQSRTIQNRHRYTLENAESRYFLVWITELESGSMHVNEVTAR